MAATLDLGGTCSEGRMRPVGELVMEGWNNPLPRRLRLMFE